MSPDQVLTFLASVLAFSGVLLGLLVVAITGLADKVAHYRTDSEEFSRHVTRIGEFFGQKPEDLSIAGEFPKETEELLEMLMGLMRLTVVAVAVLAIGVGVAMAILVARLDLASEYLGLILTAALIGLILVTVFTVILVLTVIEVSEAFATLRVSLHKMQSGRLKLTKDGKEVTYDPSQVMDINIIERGDI